MLDNQPVIYDESVLLHNGIIVNHEKLWNEVANPRKLKIDSEIISALAEKYLLENDNNCEGLGDHILDKIDGVANCASSSPKNWENLFIFE